MGVYSHRAGGWNTHSSQHLVLQGVSLRARLYPWWQVLQLHPLMSLIDHKLLGRNFESRWLIVASRGLLMGLLGFKTLWGRGPSSLTSSSIHPLQSSLRTLG